MVAFFICFPSTAIKGVFGCAVYGQAFPKEYASGFDNNKTASALLKSTTPSASEIASFIQASPDC